MDTAILEQIYEICSPTEFNEQILFPSFFRKNSRLMRIFCQQLDVISSPRDRIIISQFPSEIKRSDSLFNAWSPTSSRQIEKCDCQQIPVFSDYLPVRSATIERNPRLVNASMANTAINPIIAARPFNNSE